MGNGCSKDSHHVVTPHNKVTFNDRAHLTTPIHTTDIHYSQFHGMDLKERELFTLINNYRMQHGLHALEPSANLAHVARTHAIDVVENNPDVDGGNIYSWSYRGRWKAVKYISDHPKPSLMWSKPSEISNYKSDGFEIAFAYGRDVRKQVTVNPVDAFHSWTRSKGHNNVILQRGKFHGVSVKCMGVGIYMGYACVWFGEELDLYPPPT